MSAARTRLLAGAGILAAAAAAVLGARFLRARRAARPVRLPTAGRPLAVVRAEAREED